MTPETRLWINGAYVPSISGTTFPVENPSTQTKAADVFEALEADVEAAVVAAEAAQPAWEEVAAYERAMILQRAAQLLRDNAEELAGLDAICMGMPVSRGVLGIANAAKSLDHFAGLAMFTHGESSLNTPGFLNLTVRQPFGVVAGIVPWNVPIGMLCWKVGPAIVSGNAIILKTSEKSPLSGLRIGALFKEAGVPDGIVNIISGAGTTGKLLSEHMRIRKIAFTGSAHSGKLVQQAAAASNLKNVTLELGGKSPLLIFEDAIVADAVAAATLSISYNSGQICMASTRIYVHESLHDEFVKAFQAAYTGQSIMGDPLDRKTTQGPMADAIQQKTVLEYIELGKKEGTVLVGGKAPSGVKGYFVEPTIFTGVADSSRINKEEVFGPVVIVHTFKTEAEAVQRANDTQYGLYASLFTRDVSRAIRVGKKLEAGAVGINCTSPTIAPDMPFGGYKASGLGRELGSQALGNWLEVKSLFIKI
ncbi:hypothetical protein RQP46_005327 [Phenoliferia psychrophenolica]